MFPGLPLPRVCDVISNVSGVETEMSRWVLILSESPPAGGTYGQSLCDFPHQTQPAWNPACRLCYIINVVFTGTKKSLVFSITAPNYISEMTFSCHGIGFLSPRESYLPQRLEGIS